MEPRALAEHRARRAELVEEDLLERAARAERASAGLDVRLEEAEGRLAAAEAARAGLATLLEQAERALSTALRRESERARARAAEEVAAREHHGLPVVPERVARELRATLLEERAARAELDRMLAVEREQAAVQLSLLRQEIDHRAVVHDVIATHLSELRDGVAAVRARVDAADERATGAEAALAAAVDEQQQLRDALETLAAEQQRGAEARRAEEELTEALRAKAAGLEAELARTRSESIGRAAREDAVAELVAGLVTTAHKLRAGFQEALGTLTADRDAELEAERAAFAAELAAMEQHVADLREQHAADLRRVVDQLDAETTAHAGAKARLEREATQRAASRRREIAAVDAMTDEAERPRAVERPPVDGLSLVPLRDHPALVRPELEDSDDGSAPPVVVVDLMRAAERLRAQAPEPASAPEASPPEASAVEVAPRWRPSTPGTNPAPTRPEPFDPALEREATRAASDALRAGPEQDTSAPAEQTTAPAGSPVARPVAPTTDPWFSAALTALAAVDSASAERVLLAALCVQARTVSEDVVYELVLTSTGSHRVDVGRRGSVAVVPSGSPGRGDAAFRLKGSVGALAPLVTGAAPRRLRGVSVRGRRRRLRRLLRSLEAPVGLPELRAAGAQPSPVDVLSLLCLAVPAAEVRGADFRVAYVVASADGDRTRTLVRAEPDGAITVLADAGGAAAADATVTTGPGDLLEVLAGAEPAVVEGDHTAAATLRRWLCGVQGLPV